MQEEANKQKRIADEMDFVNNKVKCRKIELMMPKLMGFVEREMKSMG